jgi:hypothetical protein
MVAVPNTADLLNGLYDFEVSIAGFLDGLGLQFAPVFIYGDVGTPGLVNIAQVTPQTTVSASYTAAGTPVSDTFTGANLWSLLQNNAGGITTTDSKNDILSKYVVATGADGYQAVYSAGELDPNFGNRPITVATSDTAGQLGPKGSDGLSRVVVPGDNAGGRYVSELVSLNVGSLPEPGPTGNGGYSPQATLSGTVTTPTTLTADSLAHTGQTEKVTATYASAGGQTTDTYTGVSLWNVIQDAGLLTDPAVKNDLLHDIVVATGSDGYRAVFSLGEIAPQFGNQNDIVAYADTAGQLGGGGADGALRIVVPGDAAGGRYVSNLTSLQVIDVTAPHTS